MTYGYEAHGHEDKIINATKRMHEFGTEKILPGALLVNHLPFRMSSGLSQPQARLNHVRFSTPHTRMASVA
jgi:hypothetical protein